MSNQIELTKQQLNAVDAIFYRVQQGESVSILTGYAGTGKTTTLNYLIPQLNYQPNEIALAAYTGTAAKNIKIADKRGQTLHSLIYDPIMKRGVCVGFKRKSPEELASLKLILIDEFSMVPQDMMEDILSFGIQVMLIGDPAQLPPIGDPNMFFNSSHAHLTDVHRQALGNPILNAATKIREGDFVPDGNYGNILLVDKKKNLKQEWLRKDVQFVVGRNTTREKINSRIAGPRPFIGAKIMFLKNDKNGITNGTFAEILKLKNSYGSYKLDVITDDNIVITDYWADFNEQKNKKNQFFSLAYAITTHKSQGATFDCRGVIVDESSFFKGQERQIRYTALTRFTGNYPVVWLR